MELEAIMGILGLMIKECTIDSICNECDAICLLGWPACHVAQLNGQRQDNIQCLM